MRALSLCVLCVQCTCLRVFLRVTVFECTHYNARTHALSARTHAHSHALNARTHTQRHGTHVHTHARSARTHTQARNACTHARTERMHARMLSARTHTSTHARKHARARTERTHSWVRNVCQLTFRPKSVQKEPCDGVARATGVCMAGGDHLQVHVL